MFAIFGLGMPEIIILAVIGVVIVAVPVAILFVVLGTSRRSADGGPSEVTQLRAEVARLRDENDRLREQPRGSSDPGIASGAP